MHIAGFIRFSGGAVRCGDARLCRVRVSRTGVDRCRSSGLWLSATAARRGSVGCAGQTIRDRRLWIHSRLVYRVIGAARLGREAPLRTVGPSGTTGWLRKKTREGRTPAALPAADAR